MNPFSPSTQNMTRTCILSLSLALILSYAPSRALAGQDAESLGTCLTDSSTGKERKALARWVFLAMSQHPEIQSLSSATEADRTASQKEMAEVVTRLVTIQCVQQVKRAVSSEGAEGMMLSFRVLGEMAMRELMTDPKVSSAMGGYVPYLDKEKFDKVLSEK